jgi:hypothetical protein
MDTGHQIVDRDPLGESGGNLLLRPDGADIADLGRGPALQRGIAHLFQFEAEGVRNDLDESSAACRALVIHDEVGWSAG